MLLLGILQTFRRRPFKGLYKAFERLLKSLVNAFLNKAQSRETGQEPRTLDLAQPKRPLALALGFLGLSEPRAQDSPFLASAQKALEESQLKAS